MNEYSGIFIAAGIILVTIGIALYFGLPVGRLPGDIFIEEPSFRFYFPITTSIIASAVLWLILIVVNRLK